MDVSVLEARTMVESNPVLVVLDVRNQSEYDSGHIRNAKLIPLQELELRLGELNVNDEILVYCESGARSTTASQLLEDHGFSHVYNLLEGISAWIDAGYPAYVKYPSLQGAVNNASDEATIFVSSGTYNEHVVVNKTISLLGENPQHTFINGNGTQTVLNVPDNRAIRAKISCFTVQNGTEGILLGKYANRCTVTDCIVVNNGVGILVMSNDNTLTRNMVVNNTGSGIKVYATCYCLPYTQGNIVTENNVINNNYGIELVNVDKSTVYHNNIINNTHQATCNDGFNNWDNGYPSGGNYWNDYDGTDLFHGAYQNETGSDGIGDEPYYLGEYQDNYPLMGMFAEGYPVHNIDTGLSYATIQAAIDAFETLNGHTIFVEEGTYYEHITVKKSLTLTGENRSTTIIDGNNTGTVVWVTANSVVFREFTVRNGSTGIHVYNSDNSVIEKNYVIDNGDAIYVRYSDYCMIGQNVAANNTDRGIFVTNSQHFTVTNNYVYRNDDYGINANASTKGLISQNNVYENHYDGIGLLESSDCTVTGNNVSENTIFGIWLDSSNNNFIYYNNIIDNTFQATTNTLTNHWDDGIEGNYWSDYGGIDTNQDGIADDAYVLNEVVDNFPLTGMFHSFNAFLGIQVNVISSTAVGNFEYFNSNNTIRMSTSNATGNSDGFCRVRIPHALMVAPYNVTIDGANPLYWNYTLYDDGDHRWIYFTYQNIPHTVTIKGTPPDVTPPTISVISPENKTYTVNNVSLTFTVNEPASWIGYSLDGAANVTVAGNMTLSGLAEGLHSLTVYANDTSGNMGVSETIYFSVNTPQEQFPTLLVAVVAAAVGVGAALLIVYFRKVRKPK